MAKSLPIFQNDSTVYNPDELIDLFLECTADGICIVDTENRFIRVNHMYTKIFGYTEEDIIGRTFHEFNNPDEMNDIINQIKGGRVITNLITQKYHKDGSILDIAVSYSPLKNTSGKIIAIIAIFRDITELVNMERELIRTRELYRLITENTTDIIKVVSKEKKIVYASPSHEKMIGHSSEQLVGRDLYDIILPCDQEQLDGTFKKVLETGEPQLIQKRIKTKTDEVIYSETNISPIYNEQQEIESFVTVGRNITERIENDAAIRNLDRLSIIGQLAAGVAHEIRNPLTSLKGFSKLLQNTRDKNDQNHYISIIKEELDRIDMIVNEFMSLAKPQAISFERENVISILESTVNVLHPQAMLHNVQINLNVPTDEIEMQCSPHQLKQVFVNFIKNAIEAMPNGGNVYITVQKEANQKVLITFTDEGVGIDREVQRFLGTPFYTTKDKGIGLGLTVSNKIIQEHNGTMKIESSLGHGTTIRMELNCI